MMTLSLAVLLVSWFKPAQATRVEGFWRDSTGSVVEVFRCVEAECVRVASVSAGAPTKVDSNNPNAALHGRALCGLVIGNGFRLVDADHAEDGRLYDPKSGRTYRGSMAAGGDELRLRGYVGLKILGRTEVWTRVQRVTECPK